MANSKKQGPQRGRPRTEGNLTQVTLGLDPDLLSQVDARLSEVRVQYPSMKRVDLLRALILAGLKAPNNGMA